MSLGWTKVAIDKHIVALEYKVRYLLSDESTSWNTWVDGLGATPTADETAAKDKFSSYAISVIVDQGFIPGFSGFGYPFMTKWSGACLEDYSSKVGGFCLLEENDNPMDETNDFP